MQLTDKQEQILKSLGLKNHFETDESSPDYYNIDQIFSSGNFISYMPASYKNDGRLREMDEVHDFSRDVFMHTTSGIRFQYEIYERYGIGDVYKLSQIFVITQKQEYLDVISADFNNRKITTEKGVISYENLKRRIEKID